MKELSKRALGISPSLTLKIDALSKEMRHRGEDVIGFGAGEPDFDTPEYIKKAAEQAILEGKTKYTPASGTVELKQAVCDRYMRKYDLAYQPSQVVVSNGAKHSLYNVMNTLINPGDEVILITPYWLTYPELVRMAGGVPVFVEAREADSFQPDPETIRQAVTPRTVAIVVNSPSNPCGCVYTRKTMEGIAALAEEYDLWIISDEIYDDLTYIEDAESIACVSADAKARTIIVNGMSKSYAMTGWRIGYAIAPEEVARVMGSYQSQATSNPCSIAQFASVEALNGPQTDIELMLAVFEHRSRLMHRLINKIDGISCRLPEGAFYVMANISSLIGKSYRGEKITDSVKFAELLLKGKLVAVVPGKAFGADNYVSLSYATSEENIRRCIRRLGVFVAELED